MTWCCIWYEYARRIIVQIAQRIGFCFFLQNRSFVFGASAQQPQQPQVQQDNKPAFNFSAGMTPNFNFGGQANVNAAETQQQQQQVK